MKTNLNLAVILGIACLSTSVSRGDQFDGYKEVNQSEKLHWISMIHGSNQDGQAVGSCMKVRLVSNSRESNDFDASDIDGEYVWFRKSENSRGVCGLWPEYTWKEKRQKDGSILIVQIRDLFKNSNGDATERRLCSLRLDEKGKVLAMSGRVISLSTPIRTTWDAGKLALAPIFSPFALLYGVGNSRLSFQCGKL